LPRENRFESGRPAPTARSRNFMPR